MMLMMPFAVPARIATSPRPLVEHCFRLRLLGLSLAAIGIGSVLYCHRAHPLIWALLAINLCAWPPLAQRLAQRSRDTSGAEIRNRLIDSAMGGLWIALMQFNLLPSVLLAAMLAIDKANLGGWRLLGRGLLVQAAACVLTLALHGFAFAPQTGMAEIVACLPLLVAYPLAIGMSMHTLARHRHEHNLRLIQMQNGEVASESPGQIG